MSQQCHMYSGNDGSAGLIGDSAETYSFRVQTAVIAIAPTHMVYVIEVAYLDSPPSRLG